MSMPVNNIRPILLAPLPLLLLAVCVCVVIWLVTQNDPLPTGKRLSVHQALSNIPEKDIDKHLSELTPETMFTGRDPFFRNETPQKLDPIPHQKNTETVADLREIYLTTIAHGKRGSYCMVNGNIYNIGQQGDGFTVTSISQDHVVFSTPAQSFTLKPGEQVTLDSGRILTTENRARGLKTD